jgi:murein DD-endopeptidase MepM/ murein hydrolase activator NlpD
VQRIDGLPPRQVTPPQEVLDRIRVENIEIGKARANDTPQAWFAGGFVWPAIGPISGVYGSQRILNGKPRQPHYGVDVAMPTGTPVRAPAPGRVTLAENDLYFTGGTVILDHGHGVTSAFLHMSKVHVQVGDVLGQGDLLGEIGATGRVTGAHLDWRVNWFKVRIDPELVVGPMPDAATN